MKIADLPIHYIKRLMTADEATKLVGTFVPQLEPTCNEPGIWVDEDTKEVVFVYFPMEEEVNLLRAAVMNIKYGSTSRASGIDNLSRTFGMAPRKAQHQRESCRPTSLAADAPDEHAVLVRFAKKFADMYKEFAPDLFAKDAQVLESAGVSDEWKMTDDALWTSGVVNKSATLPYHRDGFNFETWSAMPVVRRSMGGGYLNFPEYGLTCSCRDGWVTFFAGYKYVHGVTPMTPKTPDAYRYSVVYYALRGMKDCFTYAVETARGRETRADREVEAAQFLKGEAPMKPWLAQSQARLNKKIIAEREAAKDSDA
jgi:hypothetical protein